MPPVSRLGPPFGRAWKAGVWCCVRRAATVGSYRCHLEEVAVPGRRLTLLVLAFVLVVVMPGAVAQAKPSVTFERYGTSGGEVQTDAEYLARWVDDAFGPLPATR